MTHRVSAECSDSAGRRLVMLLPNNPFRSILNRRRITGEALLHHQGPLHALPLLLSPQDSEKMGVDIGRETLGL